jgi:hypothetical protein
MKQLLKALRARHALVANKIDDEQRRPQPDGFRVRSLKKIKLRLKEQIAFLERAETTRTAPATDRFRPFGRQLSTIR